jgi:hypothetical protein
VLGAGFLGWAIYAVYTIPEECWSGRRRSYMKGLLWGSWAIYLLLALVMIGGYNSLSGREAITRWRIRLTAISRLLGCYQLLKGEAHLHDLQE